MAVYKRGTVWYCRFMQDGKLIRLSTKATTKREAELAAADVMLQKQEKAASGLTLREAIMRCYDEEWQHSKSGLKMVNRTLKIVDILGDIPLDKVDEEEIGKLVRFLTKQGLSQASINRYRAYLRRVLNLANKKWRELDRVPYIKNTREVAKRFKVYTETEEQQILSSTPLEFSELATLLFDTGLRLGEALRLAHKQVYFASNLLTVWADETKGMKTRSIPMTRRVHHLLQNRALPFSFKDEHEVERIWNRFKKAQGIVEDGWVIHAMRHTFASRLVQRGVDLYTVKTLLGHSTISVTEKYAHLNPEKLAHAIVVLEA
jgi:site-specific recombinase XerD